MKWLAYKANAEHIYFLFFLLPCRTCRSAASGRSSSGPKRQRLFFNTRILFFIFYFFSQRHLRTNSGCPEDAGAARPAGEAARRARGSRAGRRGTAPPGRRKRCRHRPCPAARPAGGWAAPGRSRAAPLRLGVSRRDAAASAMSWRSGSRGVVLTAYHSSGGAGDAPGG